MSLVEEIKAARRYGVTRCGLSSHVSPTLPELAVEFGLDPAPDNYREIEGDTARRLARSILHRDLAYRAEVMSEERAADLADRFLAQFGDGEERHYTNGTFDEDRTVKGASWNPVTTATFDTGVLVVGPRGSGCLWVEDED